SIATSVECRRAGRASHRELHRHLLPVTSLRIGASVIRTVPSRSGIRHPDEQREIEGGSSVGAAAVNASGPSSGPPTPDPALAPLGPGRSFAPVPAAGGKGAKLRAGRGERL